MKEAIDENSLLQGLARNDKKAVESIYRESFNTIHALVVNNNGSSDDAKDIFQEAMIVLYEKVRSGSFELNCQIRTYLYAVARRLWLKRLQQMDHYLPSVENLDASVSVEEEVEEHERRNVEFETMDKAISSLGEPCKSLLVAYYLEKRSMQEIALGFGYTNSDNAKNQKYKCLMRLKKIFFSHYKIDNSNG